MLGSESLSTEPIMAMAGRSQQFKIRPVKSGGER